MKASHINAAPMAHTAIPYLVSLSIVDIEATLPMLTRKNPEISSAMMAKVFIKRGTKC